MNTHYTETIDNVNGGNDLNDHNNTVLYPAGYKIDIYFNLFIFIFSVSFCLNLCRTMKIHRERRNQLEILHNHTIFSPRMVSGYSTMEPQYKVIKIKEHKFIDESSSEICPICLDNYKKDDILNELKCGHKYHNTCIDDWIKNNNNCPLCRLSI